MKSYDLYILSVYSYIYYCEMSMDWAGGEGGGSHRVLIYIVTALLKTKKMLRYKENTQKYKLWPIRNQDYYFLSFKKFN